VIWLKSNAENHDNNYATSYAKPLNSGGFFLLTRSVISRRRCSMNSQPLYMPEYTASPDIRRLLARAYQILLEDEKVQDRSEQEAKDDEKKPR
jgi:hypothetical protein